jgi:hypothetical protein
MPSPLTNIDPRTQESIVPGAYIIKSIVLTNHSGKTAEISNIVADFKITESVYSPVLTVVFRIKDEANFFEEYQLIGQEKVEVSLFRKPLGAVQAQEIQITFFITEYPVYGRGTKQSVSLYTMKGMTRHGFISTFKTISRSVESNTAAEIKKILQNDLLVEKYKVNGNPVSVFKGVIPIMKPLEAASWLTSKSYDENGFPFFLYETIWDRVILGSYSNLSDIKTNPIMRIFEDHKIFRTQPRTLNAFIEQQNRILTFSSQLNLSKVYAARKGAYSSTHVSFDIANKKIDVKKFNYEKDLNKDFVLNKTPCLSSKFGIPIDNSGSSKKYNEMFDSRVTFHPLNSLAFNSSKTNLHNIPFEFAGKRSGVLETLDSYSIELQVYGDFRLNAGRRIQVKVPKAIDPIVYQEEKNKANIDKLYDEVISGTYLIIGVVHDFSSEYTCTIKAQKDSINTTL